MRTIEILIYPKPEVLDPAGRVIEEMVRKKNSGVSHFSLGKTVQFQSDVESDAEAMVQGEKIARGFLINDLIEEFRVRVLGS